MDDRQRLEAIVSVINKYLPPDGIPINDAMSEIISLVDPLPAPQPVQEPTPLQGLAAYLRCEAGGVFVGLPNHDTLMQWAREVDAARAQPPLPAQEPVAWVWKDMRGQDIVSLFEPRFNSVPLYTAPPQREWNAALDEAASRIGEIKGFGKATQDSFAIYIHGLKK